jgi:hypothetical protein
MQHPDFAVLTVSWELALRADGYANNTVKAYQNAVRSLADWLAEHHPEVRPAELDRQHIGAGWSRSANATPVTRREDGSPASGTSAAGSRVRARRITMPPLGSGHRLRAIPRRRSWRMPTYGP